MPATPPHPQEGYSAWHQKERGNSHDESRRKNQPGGNIACGKHSRLRASNFRNRKEYQHVIELIDVDDNHSKVRARGWMNGMQHDTVLQVLTHLVQWLHHRRNVMPKDQQHSWTIDETGMLEISWILLSSELKQNNRKLVK